MPNWRPTGELCNRGHETIKFRSGARGNSPDWNTVCLTCHAEARKTKASITHCKNGHPYTGDNLITKNNRRSGGTVRICRECKKEKERRRKAKKQAAKMEDLRAQR